MPEGSGLPERVRRSGRAVLGTYLSGEAGERQNVAVGVLEPSDVITTGSRPDTSLVLLHAVVANERDPTTHKSVDRGVDVRDLHPAMVKGCG